MGPLIFALNTLLNRPSLDQVPVHAEMFIRQQVVGACLFSRLYRSGGWVDVSSDRLGTSALTVSKWKIRFEDHGLEWLQGGYQGSKSGEATPVMRG